MQKINWYPEYWTFIEKNKLFDYWRSRYAKNQLIFSPNQLSFPVDFFDASYESLKYQTNEEVEREWEIHKRVIEGRLFEASNEDKKRLQLQYFAEIKGYEYWIAKIVLRPIEEDEVGILKDTLWIINERERAFKEAFAQLVEYDRRYLSPLSDPERELIKNPLNISESYHWLIRNNIPLQIMQDIDFFQAQKKKGKIKPLNEEEIHAKSYLPLILKKRHEKALNREKSRGFFRSSNGEILHKDNKANLFARPEQIYATENNEASLLEQIESFQKNSEKYELDKYSNTVRILDSDKYHLNFSGIFKDRGRSLPKSPYALIQKRLFDKMENGTQEDKEKIYKALKDYADRRNRGEYSAQPEIAEIEKEEDKKGNIFSNLLYFYQTKRGEISVKKTDGTFINPEKVLSKEGLFFLEVEEQKNLEEFMPDYVDDFDDKTRFRFFKKDWFGLKFNRENAIKELLKPLKEIKHGNILKAFKSILGKDLNKTMEEELSNGLNHLQKYTPKTKFS